MAKKAGVKHGANLLSANEVKGFTRKGRLNDGAGLSLSVDGRGYRRWIFRYSFGGKPSELFLGAVAQLTLAQARAVRDKAKGHLVDGDDPAERMSAKARKRHQAVTAGIPAFGEYAIRFIADLAPTFKSPKARQPWERALQVYAKPLHPLRLNAITATDVATVLRPLWHSKRETARRLRWRIEAVFAAAIVAGYREADAKGRTITQRNPAAWRDNLEQLPGFKTASTKPAQRHHAAMPYQDVPAFLSELRGMEALSARALQLAILTATCTGETLGARWDELDLAAGLWTIPAHRMKAKREHVIPLSRPALDLLKAMPRIEASPFVFPGLTSQKHLSGMAMLMLLRRMGRDDVTAHGFRSSFRTWAAESTTFPREIAEMALAHQVGTDVERAYNRTTLLERRRALADAWAMFCKPQVAGNVVEMKRAK